MTTNEFKTRWESNTKGGGITFDDIAECAVKWGILSRPRTKPLLEVRYLVLKEANTNDAEKFKPQEIDDESK